MAFLTIWSLSCLLKSSFKNPSLPEALSGLVDERDPVPRELKCVLFPFSEVLAPPRTFATVAGFRTGEVLIVGTRGFHLAGVQAGPQAPLACVSASGHFLTCISSSEPPLWLEARPDGAERLSFSLFKLLLVLPTQALHLVCIGG